MSVRTLRSTKHDVRTDPRWYPVTRGLNRWVNRISGRNDLVVRVPKKAPAAAVFNTENASIDIRESTISRIDPTMSVIDLLAKYPEEMGTAVHETAHAAFSAGLNLPAMMHRYGRRHTSVFLLLEEGRCESHLWNRLGIAEQCALSMMVPRFVLTNLQDEEDEEEIDLTDIRMLVRLVGLLAARRHKGIVTDGQAKVAKIWALITTTLPNADEFEALAIKFAGTPLGYYSSNEEKLHEIVRQWMALEDALPKPQPDDSESEEGEGDEGKSEPGEGESGEGEPGEGTGGGPTEGDTEDDAEAGQPAGADESDEEGEAAVMAEGSESHNDPDDGIIGDDDEGVIGEEDAPDTGGEGDGALGEYNSIDPETIADVLSEVIEDLRESVPEAKKIHGSRLGEEVRAVHKASAKDHEQRRRDNKEALKKWRNK